MYEFDRNERRKKENEINALHATVRDWSERVRGIGRRGFR